MIAATADMRALVLCAVILLLPIVIVWGFVVGSAYLAWFFHMKWVLTRLRERHYAYWLLAGQPSWQMDYWPDPTVGRPRSERVPQIPRPSYRWAVTFSMRNLPTDLSGDAQLLRVHRRAAVLIWAVAICGSPLPAYAAVFIWAAWGAN